MYETAFHTQSLNQYKFLVTGGAGFIGSHLVEYLLKHKAGKVRVLDNLLTGSVANMQSFSNHPDFEFLHGDIRNENNCAKACKGIDFIFHEAALGSVPRSMSDPHTTHQINETGFLNILVASHKAEVKRVVYASSSSVYGDSTELPKREENIGNPLSPYAVGKLMNEKLAQVYASQFNMEIIGLRYFNIFGPRQDPAGPYAAVVPRFIDLLKKNKQASIYGNGEQTRDFTYVENAVQANVKAMFTNSENAHNQIFNIAAGESFSVNQLYRLIASNLHSELSPVYEEFRQGDIAQSWADISKAKKMLAYDPKIRLEEGIQLTLTYFK